MATPAALSTTSGSAEPGAKICKVADNGGTYYLDVTSASEHDFSACAGNPFYDGNIDTLLAIPKMDRRCKLPNESTRQFHALIAAYSDTTKANLAAAHAYCSANHGADN